MANLNRIFLIGNLTRDPQLAYTPNQTPVCDFGIATNRRWKSQDGEQREEVCFVDCRAFGRTAETLNKYLTKGQPVFLEGRLKFEHWQAQDGSNRSKHRVFVEGFQFINNRLRPNEQSKPDETEENKDNEPGWMKSDDIPF